MLVLTTLRITPCSHFRDPSDNFGKSIGRTSTFPGPTYTTPRLLAINVCPFKNPEYFGARCRHAVILLSTLFALSERFQLSIYLRRLNRFKRPSKHHRRSS